MDFVELEGESLLFSYGNQIIFGRGFKLFNIDKSKLIFTNIIKGLGLKKKPDPKKIAVQIQILKQFYLEKPLADLTFIVEGKKIPAHKSILAMKCPFFLKMFQSKFISSIY